MRPHYSICYFFSHGLKFTVICEMAWIFKIELFSAQFSPKQKKWQSIMFCSLIFFAHLIFRKKRDLDYFHENGGKRYYKNTAPKKMSRLRFVSLHRHSTHSCTFLKRLTTFWHNLDPDEAPQNVGSHLISNLFRNDLDPDEVQTKCGVSSEIQFF